MSNLIKKKIAVIGCGPVGMFGSLLLSHLQLDHISVEKFSSPRTHPSAHYINPNSKALLHQIPGLTEKMDSMQQSWKYFQYYRYTEGVCGYELGKTNHFEPNIEDKLKECVEAFGQKPSHLAQNKFLQLMFEHIDQKERIKFDEEIVQIKKKNNKNILINKKGQEVVQAQYVIICNGINSTLRKDLGFTLSGKQQLFNVINIYFKSKQLAEKIVSHQNEAMLHFSFGGKIVGVIVNHSIEEGVFVAQIPNYMPIINIQALYSGRDLVKMLLSKEIADQVNDIQIIHNGLWAMQGLVADKMQKQNIFLAGDTAHAFPPSGGFGMNTGIQDIHELIHALKLVIENEDADKKQIFERYCRNRREIDRKYCRKSLQNYNETTDIARSLGYPYSIFDYFPRNSFFKSIFSWLPESSIPAFEQFRLKNMNFFYKRKKVSPKLQLLFNDFDLQVQHLSSKRKEILLQNIKHDLWVKKGTDTQKIREYCGDIRQERINWYEGQGEQIIGSDGNVILK